ncbi:MAG: hypothetical protein HWN67_09190 [Candidatus Helarchaeota archaeon]|nr:hypothetical protein [Candidatus Helarchaeota archaeon]
MIYQLDFWKMMGLGITFILSSNAIFLFYYFISKIYHSKEFKSEIFPFYGITLLFLFGGISYIFANVFDFFRWQYDITVLIYYRFHFIFYVLSVASCIFVYENLIKKTKYLLTIYMIGVLIINFFIVTYEALNLFSNFTFGFALLILLILQYVVFVRPTSGILKHRMYITLVGLMIVGFGSVFRNPFINEAFSHYFFSMGTLLINVGVLLMGFGFSAFSTFTDLNWKEKLHQIFIVTKDGLPVYAYSFDVNQTITDSELLAAGLSSIRIFLSEVLKTKDDLQIIEYKNLNVILELKDNIVFILVIKEKSSFLQYKLEQFSKKFSEFFKDLLKNWNGDMELFYPTKTLIRNIFELDK